MPNTQTWLMLLRLLLSYMLLLLSAPPALCDRLGPSSVYLSEGFDGVGVPAGWTITRLAGTQATWTVVVTGTNPPATPHTGAGMAKFNSYDAPDGEQARLTSPAINLSTASTPYLDLQMYHDIEFPSALDSLYIQVSTGDSVTGPWVTLRGMRRHATANGWLKEAVSLSSVAGAPRVFVGLLGVSRYGNNMFIDAFRVADTAFHDIGIVSVGELQQRGEASDITASRHPPTTASQTPATGIIKSEGLSAVFTAIVRNHGTFAESVYEVRWRVDGAVQPPVVNTEPLARDEEDSLQLVWSTPVSGLHTLTAWTFLAGDSNRANDTARATFQILDSTIYFWESFNTLTFPPSGWTAINRDNGVLTAWFRGTSSAPFLPYEGVAFAANNFQRANGNYIDDYLISPTISAVGVPGVIDSLVFMARSVGYPPPTQNYADSLMVLVSTTGSDTSAFTIQLDYMEVPKFTWTRFAYGLNGVVPPGSNINIAFRYLHFNGGPTGSNSDFVGIDAVQIRRMASTSVSSITSTPGTPLLHPNYPNPFNPLTTITYTVPLASRVTITVYNILGESIARVVDGEHAAGTHSVVFDGSALSSGVYLCVLNVHETAAPSHTATRKLILLR